MRRPWVTRNTPDAAWRRACLRRNPAVLWLLVCVVTVGCSSQAASTEPSGPSASLTTAMTKAIVGHRLSVLEPYLADAVRTASGALAQSALLPAGSTMSLDRSHEHINGNFARIPVTVSGSTAAGSWILVLVHEDGTWHILGTARR